MKRLDMWEETMGEALVVGQDIEVRGFKWPHRATSNAKAVYLGEDAFGRWIGIAAGTPWWSADGTRNGTFDLPLVKLIPQDTFWSVCFHPVDPVVDVDIILPVQWIGNVVEEVDLELDILKTSDGRVTVRDEDLFAQVRHAGDMPDDIAKHALATFDKMRGLIEDGTEPFASVGQARLVRFIG